MTQSPQLALRMKASYDLEYAAAARILFSPMLVHQARVWEHVSEHGIRFDLMLRRRGWSSAERALLQVASSLFNGDTAVNLNRLTGVLSPSHLRVVVEAIALLAGIRPLELAPVVQSGA